MANMQGCVGGHHQSQKKLFSLWCNGVFQGDLGPLSSCAVVESCVMPVLPYRCENWVLTEQLISRLETSLGELAKRILKLPRWASNTAANVVMGWTIVRARVVVQKLNFLHRLVSAERERVWVAGLW